VAGLESIWAPVKGDATGKVRVKETKIQQWHRKEREWDALYQEQYHAAFDKRGNYMAH
jgi:hypothetical protein